MSRALLLAAAFALAACAVKPIEPDDDPGGGVERVDPPDARTDDLPALPDPAQAWMDRTNNLGTYDADQLAEIADTPMYIAPIRVILSDEAQDNLATLKSLNPDLLVIGMSNTLSVMEDWDNENQRQRFPLADQGYDLLTDHRAVTTTGDEPLMWLDAPMINPWSPQGLKIDLLLDWMDLVSTLAIEYPVLDGVFHDYLSGFPHLYPGQTNVGDVDLDGDGVGARDDADDQDVWLAWQRELLAEYQLRFGEGFVQIANGRLPHLNPEIASMVAGIAYESFPITVWGYTHRGGLDLALEHLAPNYLTPRRGATWSLLWDRNGRNSHFCRIASMLAGQPYVLRPTEGWVGRDGAAPPQALPLGDLRITENPDGSATYERDFPHGVAHIDFNADGSPTLVEFRPN